MTDTADATTVACDGGEDMDPRLLLLDPNDNIVVARSDLLAGDELVIDCATVRLDRDAPVGFKIARRSIKTNEQVFKYGAPIGSATVSIAVGAMVHTHNMKSDYLPTYTREDGARYTQRRSS